MVYLGRTKRIHFVGIGGIGMSGIAEVLLNLGFMVSGSDLRKSDITDGLEKRGAIISIGHDANNVREADVVVYSSAVMATNPELVEAKAHAVPTIPRTEMLAELMRLKFAVTVGGSHGKTTTTSLVAAVMASGGLDPTVVVGGKLKAIRSNARLGSSRYLVAEADESDGKFVQLPSSIAVITNIDLEHLDYYPDLEAIKDVFVEYAGKVPFYGSVIVCGDDVNVTSILPRIRRKKLTYGLGDTVELRGEITKRDESGNVFNVRLGPDVLGEVCVHGPGDHLVRNSLAAIAVGLELDISFEKIKKGIETFEGVGRRFEIKGTVGGITVVDDYGHHPTEIAATIQASLGNFGRRLIVVFQPHRYTRTQALVDSFATCFEGAHKVFITDIYPAGEEPIPGVSTEMLLERVSELGSVEARYASSFDDALELVISEIQDGDMVLTSGAGDIYQVGEMLLNRLKAKR